MSGKFNIELTEEEWKRCEEIDKAGLTNYQEQALELNKRSIHFRKELKEAQKGMKEDVAKIKAIRLERLKSDPGRSREKCRSDHGKCEQGNYRSVETGSHRQHG